MRWGAVSTRHSRTVGQISARRAVAETCLHPGRLLRGAGVGPGSQRGSGGNGGRTLSVVSIRRRGSLADHLSSGHSVNQVKELKELRSSYGTEGGRHTRVLVARLAKRSDARQYVSKRPSVWSTQEFGGKRHLVERLEDFLSVAPAEDVPDQSAATAATARRRGASDRQPAARRERADLLFGFLASGAERQVRPERSPTRGGLPFGGAS